MQQVITIIIARMSYAVMRLIPEYRIATLWPDYHDLSCHKSIISSYSWKVQLHLYKIRYFKLSC